MTTIGYGDMTAKTALGKAISVSAAVLGFFEFSLPVAVFTKNFNDFFVYLVKQEKTARNVRRKEAYKNSKLKKDSVLSWLIAGRKMSSGTLNSILDQNVNL